MESDTCLFKLDSAYTVLFIIIFYNSVETIGFCLLQRVDSITTVCTASRRNQTGFRCDGLSVSLIGKRSFVCIFLRIRKKNADIDTILVTMSVALLP